MRAPGPETVFSVSPPESATPELRDNPLAEYFFRNSVRLIHKWHHYFEIYHRHFARFRGRAPVLIEIGVQHGGALHMWGRYIDDGGHTMAQQITTFQELYPHVQPRGVYVCEDLHTSYQPHWGGGLGRPGTFIEVAKLLVDRLHAWYYTAPGEPLDDFALDAYSLNFYDSMLVIEKRPLSQPRSSMVGRPSF